MDYDLVYLSTPGVMIDWAGEQYASLADFIAATGQEQPRAPGRSEVQERRDVDNFQLKAGSPAIDSANSGAAGQPATDAQGKARKDDPATAEHRCGPRPFDDRGAFEFQPK